MGRHRRSAAGRAATGRATGITHDDGPLPRADRGDGPPTMGTAPYLNPQAYAETYAKSEAYLYATDGAGAPAGGGDFTRGGFQGAGFSTGPDRSGHAFTDDGLAPDDAPGAGGHRRRKKKTAAPVRTGLLGVSAAVALGAVAVTTGAVPGLENYRLGGDSASGDHVQAGNAPTNSPSGQGGTSGSLENPGRDAGAPASRDAERSASSGPAASASASAAPTKAPQKRTPEKEETPAAPEETTQKTPSREATPEPEPEPEKKASSPVAGAAEAVAGAEVLRLVNVERAKAGCSPVVASGSLTELATAFSADMADRGFFDHTDPDGDTPWDRARTAGIGNLGGENIARGQADAEAVMQAWMDSPGHKANILNCDFKTLGVGVRMGSGGPWWTQNFGY